MKDKFRVNTGLALVIPKEQQDNQPFGLILLKFSDFLAAEIWIIPLVLLLLPLCQKHPQIELLANKLRCQTRYAFRLCYA